MIEIIKTDNSRAHKNDAITDGKRGKQSKIAIITSRSSLFLEVLFYVTCRESLPDKNKRG